MTIYQNQAVNNDIRKLPITMKINAISTEQISEKIPYTLYTKLYNPKIPYKVYQKCAQPITLSDLILNNHKNVGNFIIFVHKSQ